VTKQFYFLAGIPRSGSTVLASILNQNPQLYATPTSPMLDLLYLNEQAWRKLPSVIANPIQEQLPAISQAIISSCWEHVPQTHIIDKHRAWGRNTQTIRTIFGIEPKIIVTVRDIPGVLASFMRLLRESNQRVTYIDRILIDRSLPVNDANRVDVLWNDFVQDPWDSFKTAWEQDRGALHLVDYDELVTDRESVIRGVYSFLELPHYEHDYNNIDNPHSDDDLLAWGLENLHTIRPQLAKTALSPRQVLGDRIYNKYANMGLEFWK
jgi:sulfotransferase